MTGPEEKRLIIWADITRAARVRLDHEACMSFEVLDLTGYMLPGGEPCFETADASSSSDTTEDADKAEVLASGFIKFDGCSHWSFQNDTMLHLCGRPDMESWAAMMSRLFDEAARLIGDSWCGDTEVPA